LSNRDLKPENSLIDKGINKISDFGFGRVVNDYKNQQLTTGCGTPCYMAPQLLMGKPYTTKSDVWSMGIIYFEILFATLPWECRT
jgi:serine/threonine protein kinase